MDIVFASKWADQDKSCIYVTAFSSRLQRYKYRNLCNWNTKYTVSKCFLEHVWIFYHILHAEIIFRYSIRDKNYSRYLPCMAHSHYSSWSTTCPRQCPCRDHQWCQRSAPSALGLPEAPSLSWRMRVESPQHCWPQKGKTSFAGGGVERRRNA